MEKFEVNILGCGSALPTSKRFTTSQVVNLREKLFMVDCCEGAQILLRSSRLKFSRLNHIFLSHLHGDHCFGIPGLISSLGMLGRTGDLVIHGQADAQKIFKPLLDYFCKELPFTVRFNTINPSQSEVIFEDRSLRVHSIPLKHRVPTCGFLFEELPSKGHLIGDMIKFYKIPIRQLEQIKDGADFITEHGELIANSRLTTAASAARKYAFCSDTAYSEKIIPYIQGIDLLYHEATFRDADAARAKQTQHSTASQAAKIASMAQVKQLMIGHFSARYPNPNILLEEAIAIFPNTVLAQEGLVCRM
ncbi:ribonuclease Z [Bacteroidales bacterium]|nr:ribonuclease Z [Bacteroidales bacterium]